jgi:peptidoglycan/LPS O-acetylase OafA/YrhL
MYKESRNLDILRASAVLAVLVDHIIASIFFPDNGLANGLGTGGVMIFFVHTCTVLLQSLERTRTDHPFLQFYIRRAFRIYPLSIVCILLVLVFHIPDMPLRPYHQANFGDILASLTLTQNIHGFLMLGPLWSLPWEVQMYAVLPLVFLATKRWRSVYVAIAAWAVLVALRYGLVAAHLYGVSYYLEYVPCFIGGVVAYRASKSWRPKLPATVWPAAVVLLLCAHAWIWREPTAVAGMPIRRLSSYVLCLVLGTLFPLCHEHNLSWFTKVANTLAKYSYGIYLFHLPIMWLAFVKLRSLTLIGQFVLFTLLMFVVPWVAFRWIENPLIELGRRLATRISRPRAIAEVSQAS